ncbi:MAG: pyridoxal phosphate-dependent aminotransferase [Chloroflexi bacterium]|nr:pyridoxal phosphate-dependent aminotransferase [Chloroflexota bacterium]
MTEPSRGDPFQKLSLRARAVESSGIRRVFDLGANLKDPINFSIGQPDFPVPPAVAEAAKKAIDDGFNSYTPTQGLARLREKVAAKLRRDNGVEARRDDVLITSGSSGGIFLVLAAILDPGDEVIIPDPYFVMYPQLVGFLGARPVFVDTYPSFQLDPERIARAVTPRTKAIMLNSPNNPTGAVYSEAALRAVAAVASRHGLLLIADEVYEPFVYDGAAHFSVGSVYPPTVTINAFSKSHALTGWRIGYATGPSPIVEKMKELQQYTFVCAPSPAQAAALVALDLGPADGVRTYQRRRDLMYEGLRRRFDVTRPQGAFYIMPRVDESDATPFVERAIASNVLLIPGSVFSQRKTHVRLSFATSEEKIQRGVEILTGLG